MQKNKDIFVQEFKSRPFAYIVQGVGILVLLLNLWLSRQLLPLAKNIDEVVSKVSAIEVRVVELETDAEKDITMLTKIETIGVQIDEMQKRLERIDTRLAKHMGI